MDNFKTPAKRKAKSKQGSTKYLPYLKTPLVRSKRSHCTKHNKLAELVNKTWQSYGATYLNNFNCNPTNLQKYSHFLTEWLNGSRAVRGSASRRRHNGQGSLKVKFDAVHNESSTTIMIDVTGTSLSNRAKASDKKDADNHYCSAILHSKVRYSDTDPDKTDSLWFPIMLVRGSAQIADQVLEFLMETFDSCIWKLNFASHELEWIVALWPSKLQADNTKPLELLYNHSDNELKRIKYQVEASDMDLIWKMLHSKSDDAVLLEEVKALFDIFRQHFFHLFRINVENLKLSAIGTPAVTANNKGKLKIFSGEIINEFLQHITSLNPLILSG